MAQRRFDRPSEYGGKAQRNGMQPPVTPRGAPGHQLTASEKLRMIYTTGQDEDSTLNPDNGEAFAGVLPIELAREKAPKTRNVFGDELIPADDPGDAYQ